MRQAQIIRSNTFQWALTVAGVFAIFVIVLFGFIYWQTDQYLIARFIPVRITAPGSQKGLAKSKKIKFYTVRQIEKLPKPVLVSRYLRESLFL